VCLLSSWKHTTAHHETHCHTLQHNAHKLHHNIIAVLDFEQIQHHHTHCTHATTHTAHTLQHTLHPHYNTLHTNCNTPPHTLHTHYNTLHTNCNTPPHTLHTHYNTLQQAAHKLHHTVITALDFEQVAHHYKHCLTLQHAATRCNTHCQTPSFWFVTSSMQYPTTTHCHTLQHAATRCNTLQHTLQHTVISVLDFEQVAHHRICRHTLNKIPLMTFLKSQRPSCPKVSTTSYRVAKTHRIPYLYRSFSAKVTYI